jgi:hypothetical protein
MTRIQYGLEYRISPNRAIESKFGPAHWFPLNSKFAHYKLSIFVQKSIHSTLSHVLDNATQRVVYPKLFFFSLDKIMWGRGDLQAH